MKDPVKSILKLLLTIFLGLMLVFFMIVGLVSSENKLEDTSYLPTVSSSEARDCLMKVVQIDSCIEVTQPDPIIFEISEPRSKVSEQNLINSYVDHICKQYEGVDPEFIKNIIWVESRYDPNAVGWHSQFLGLMQISPRWHSQRAEKLGLKDWFDPYDNIRVGVDIVAEIQAYNDDPVFVAMAYNLGSAPAIKKYASGEVTSYARAVVYEAQAKRSEVLKYAS